MNAFSNAVQSIRQNRLRSALAGFGIAWGIFLLVIFQGIGTGFRSGVMSMFSAFAQKSLFVYGGVASITTATMNAGTQVTFDSGIEQSLIKRYPCITYCSPEMTSQQMQISSDGEVMFASVKGVGESYFKIKILNSEEGRLISKLDDNGSRNVAVIGKGVAQSLFGKHSGVGKMVNIGGYIFQVIGLLASDDLFSMQERNSVYIPSGTFNSCFNVDGRVSAMCLSLSDNANSIEVEKDIKGYLAWKYGFDAHDDKAVYISNIESQTKVFDGLFNGLDALIWVVGICLLLSGIVGVCNVMLIIVKERTNEIGIRKAVGATSASVIRMIMAESITVTFMGGLIGSALGTAVVLLANNFIMPMLDSDIMGSLQVDLFTIVMAFIVLCICGVAAGLFPALKASTITPVDAIRYENRE